MELFLGVDGYVSSEFTEEFNLYSSRRTENSAEPDDQGLRKVFLKFRYK